MQIYASENPLKRVCGRYLAAKCAIAVKSFYEEEFSRLFPSKLTGLKTKLRQPTGHSFFPTFPKEFFHFLQT